jgi:hypothetical protein
MRSYARGRTLPVLLAVTALVGAANLGAYAADGHPLLLGQQNHAATTTTLTTTGRSPALSLNSSKEAPPLAVSSRKVIKNLNADRVDGRDAADLATSVVTYHLPNGPTQDPLKPPAPGTYLASISVMLSDATSGDCWIEYDGEPGIEPISIFGVVQGAYNTVTGSTVLTIKKSVKQIDFRCLSPIYSTKLNPSTVSLVRIAAHHTGHLAARAGVPGQGR